MLTITGARAAYGDIPVFSGLDLSVSAGETVSLIGPSGCGKSTLLAAAAGLKPLEEGRVDLDGSPVSSGDRRIGLVLQNYGLFPWLTVEKNAALGLKIRKTPREEIRRILEELLPRLGLRGLEHRYPGELSGGQQQRVALARTLALDPRLLLLDEPFSALDAMTREDLQELLLSLLAGRRGMTVLVTHSVEEAVLLGREILVMDPSGSGSFHSRTANPGAGEKDYRSSPEFFRRVLEIRGILADLKAREGAAG